MRAVEAMMIESGAASGAELMRRAGAGVVSSILAEWPAMAAGAQSAVVLCGPGNNGGDGFVIARMLHARGWQVAVFFYGDAARLPADAAEAYAAWQAVGPVHPLSQPEPDETQLCALADVVLPGPTGPIGGTMAAAPGRLVLIDALFGTGLTRPLVGLDLTLRLCQEARAPAAFVAVDVPSGLCADAGRVLTTPAGAALCLPADLTVSFHGRKPGHLLAEGPEICGKVVVADIGLPDDPAPQVRPVDAPRAADLDKAALRGAHKFAHGHAVVVSGGVGQGGASRLAARAALRIGAGLVTLACPPAALIENAARLDAIMLRSVRDAEALTQMLDDPRITALCIGPGLGLTRARPLVAAVLARGVPAVLDADALSVWVDEPAALFAALHPGCVLTPHLGEFARLFPDLADLLAAPASSGPAFSKLDAARAASRRAGCVVLLKGADTVIAAPDGQARIHSASGAQAAPWLATAGAGDVLAGLIAGLLARGKPPLEAASMAVWLHAASARAFGPGLTADDLSDALPGVLRALT
ncbi:NAD(P)H-hydrate dehydratase [Roseicitreum antarcticum]|nr:NAD(P)H-hydrate dehydratase [Roseicitreum antarcticum]